MVEFKIKVNPDQRLAYIPKVIAEVLGAEPIAVANRCSVIFYPEGTAIEDVIKSLDIIKKDLEHAQQLEKKKEQRKQNE